MTTPMTRPMITPIDTGLLTLAQWLGPGFPIGALAFSNGWETAIASGWVAYRLFLRREGRAVVNRGS